MKPAAIIRKCAGVVAIALLAALCVAGEPRAAERPEQMPLWSSGAAPLDAVLYHPWQRSVRFAKAALRGFWHASRDVLFPQYRVQAIDSVNISDNKSNYGAPFVDEGRLDFERRMEWHDYFIGFADSAGISELYQQRPEIVRTGFALFLGAIMLLILGAIQLTAGCCARAFVKIAYREVEDDADAAAEEAEPAPSVATGPSRSGSTSSGAPVHNAGGPQLRQRSETKRKAMKK